MRQELTGIKNLSEQAQEFVENVLYGEKSTTLSEKQKLQLARAKASIQQIHSLALEIEKKNRSLKNNQVCETL